MTSPLSTHKASQLLVSPFVMKATAGIFSTTTSSEFEIFKWSAVQPSIVQMLSSPTFKSFCDTSSQTSLSGLLQSNDVDDVKVLDVDVLHFQPVAVD